MSAAAIGGAAQAVSPGNANRFAEMQTEDFIRVLLSEMTNQDPFNPQDSAALLEQLSSLRNIESQLVLQQKLEALVLQNQVTTAGGLIGRRVYGVDANHGDVLGIVTSVRIQDGKAILELDSGQSLPMDRVTRIEARDDQQAQHGLPAGV